MRVERVISTSARFRRRAGAGAAAVLLHLVVLALIGLQAPGFTTRAVDSPATMDITILPMPSLVAREPVSTLSAAAPKAAKPRETKASRAGEVAPAAVAPPSEPAPQAPPSPAAGAGPGCEREVLMLLTAAEREHCRNQIAAEAERRTRAGQAARDAETVREARAQPKVDLIPPEKRAYYDAVQTSRQEMRAGKDFEKLGAIQAARAGTAASRNTSVDVNIAFPKCSLKFGPNKEKAKKARGLIKLGPLPCTYQVQRGPLTEDAGTPDP